MSSVLRKKIEAGAGIPPTILQFNEFWEPLQNKVSSWVFDIFGVDLKAVPETRRVVSGNIASSQLGSLLTFVFNGKLSPGLCAIAIDEAGAAANAGQRLNQGADSLDGVSPLFQKLLFEAPAAALWRLIATGLNDHAALGSQAPLSELSQVAGGFEPAQRYLMIGYNVVLASAPVRFWVVFSLDYVQRHAAGFAQQAAQQRAAASSTGRGALRDSVKHSMIKIEGVLDRITMTIGECSRLEVGHLISLPDVDTARVSLQAETVNGTVDIGHCEMGVWKRQRALKLKTPILEPFTRELAKL